MQHLQTRVKTMLVMGIACAALLFGFSPAAWPQSKFLPVESKSLPVGGESFITTNLQSGEHVSGLITIKVKMYAHDANPGVGFSIDYRNYCDGIPAPASPQLKPPGIALFTIPLETRFFPNGWHRLEFTDKDGDSASPVVFFGNTTRLPRFTVTNPRDGQIVSGDFGIHARVFDRDKYLESQVIDMFVDDMSYGEDNIRPEDDGTYGCGWGVESTRYSNGPHWIAVADNFGNVDERRVVFRNPISSVCFDPILHILRSTPPDETWDDQRHCRITATLSKPQPWKVIISAGDVSNVVQSFSGNSDHVAATWDGRDKGGHLELVGNYEITILAPVSHASVLEILNTY